MNKERLELLLNKMYYDYLETEEAKEIIDYINEIEKRTENDNNQTIENYIQLICLITKLTSEYITKVIIINKAIEHLELKQIRYLNEPEYKICTLDLQEIKDILRGEKNE